MRVIPNIILVVVVLHFLHFWLLYNDWNCVIVFPVRKMTK